MKRYMICALMLAAGSYANAAPQTFMPLEIPNVGWSVTYDTSNMVKVHRDSTEYICKGTQTSPFGSSSIVTTSGTGSAAAAGTCMFITEIVPGSPSVGVIPGLGGPAYYLTGKDYFGWTQYAGTVPPNAVSGGSLSGAPSFICRVNLGVEGYKAGLYDAATKQCTVPFQGVLKLSSEFDVLIFQAACKK